MAKGVHRMIIAGYTKLVRGFVRLFPIMWFWLTCWFMTVYIGLKLCSLPSLSAASYAEAISKNGSSLCAVLPWICPWQGYWHHETLSSSCSQIYRPRKGSSARRSLAVFAFTRSSITKFPTELWVISIVWYMHQDDMHLGKMICFRIIFRWVYSVFKCHTLFKLDLSACRRDG